jgi:tight adherence protein B
MLVPVICFTAFMTVFLGIMSIGRFLTKRKKALWYRLSYLQSLGNEELFLDDFEEELAPRKKFPGWQRIITMTGEVLGKRGLIKPLEEKLLRADILLRGEEFLLLCLLSCLLPGILVGLLTGRGLLAFLFSLVGALIPPLMVKKAREKRIKKINAQLVDALTIISNSLRAGFSFMQTIELVSKEMPNPLSKEFARTFREVNLGATTEDALNNLGERVGSEDLKLIITAVLIQRQIGGNLAEIMDNIARTIRDRIRIEGEIKTLTAQGRISGLVISLIPLFLVAVILIINPGYLTPMLHTTLGIALLLCSVVSEVVGLLIIRKVSTIDF